MNYDHQMTKTTTTRVTQLFDCSCRETAAQTPAHPSPATEKLTVNSEPNGAAVLTQVSVLQDESQLGYKRSSMGDGGTPITYSVSPQTRKLQEAVEHHAINTKVSAEIQAHRSFVKTLIDCLNGAVNQTQARPEPAEDTTRLCPNEAAFQPNNQQQIHY